MENFITVFVLTFGLFALALAGLLISWLIKGKPLERGCGKKPADREDKDCDLSSCSLCGNSDACSEKDDKGESYGKKQQ